MKDLIKKQMWSKGQERIRNLAFALSAIFILASCNHQDLDVYVENESYSNAADFVANNYNLNLFHAALKQANLLDMLKEEGPYTLFAPEDKAFNDLGIVRASDFAAMNQDSLRNMLLYHILPRRLYVSDVPRGTIDNKYVNLANHELFLGYHYEKACSECVLRSDLYVNGAKSVLATQDKVMANGVLHVIDKVLKYHTTVQDVLLSKPEYSLFVELLQRTGDWARLAQPDFTTVFAPDNNAFAMAGVTREDIANLNPDDYHKRLWRIYQVYNHFFLSDMLVFGKRYTGSGNYASPYYRTYVTGDEQFYFGITQASESDPFEAFIIPIKAANPNSPTRISKVSPGYLTDNKADNGVVHGINSLLVLPEEAKIN